MAKKKRSRNAEPNERLDRYLSAFAAALRAHALEHGQDRSSRELAENVLDAARDGELVDIFIYTCMLADRLDINLAQTARDRVSEIWQDSGIELDPRSTDPTGADRGKILIPASSSNSARAASRRSDAATFHTRKK